MKLNTAVIKLDPQNIDLAKIRLAAAVIRKGGIVAFPTETVYGLAADSTNKQAVERIFKVKNRPPSKPLTVQIQDISYLEELACDIPNSAYQLMSRFWPGPLTLIFKAKNGGTIGVRIPAHPIARSLIRESRRSIVAPSANLSGEPPAKTAQAVLETFDGLIEMVLDAGSAQLGVPSTVLDLTVRPYKILREGALSQKDIQSVQN